MIIYGWNTKKLKQAPLENYQCTQCGQKQSVLHIVANYVHIFWIPVFPYKKSAVLSCGNCGLQTEEKAIVLGSNATIHQLKSAVPMPKYLFVGLLLILSGIGYLTYGSMQKEKLEAYYIENPEIGDVYLIKSKEDTSEYNHYLFKIRDITGDSLWISYSSYNYNGVVSELDPNDGFYDIMYSIHKNEVKEYSNSGEVVKVLREYSPATGFDRDVEFIQPDSSEIISF